MRGSKVVKSITTNSLAAASDTNPKLTLRFNLSNVSDLKAAFKPESAMFFEIPQTFGLKTEPEHDHISPMTNDNSQRQKSPKSEEQPLGRPLTFSQLSEGKNELTIEHEGQLYRLRATKNGKLLLNK